MHDNITSGPSGELHGKTPVCKHGLNVKQVVNLGLFFVLLNTGGSIIAGRLAQVTCRQIAIVQHYRSFLLTALALSIRKCGNSPGNGQ